MNTLKIEKGMKVITPSGRPAVVIGLHEGGEVDLVHRMELEYEDIKPSTNYRHKVTLQPHLLRAR